VVSVKIILQEFMKKMIACKKFTFNTWREKPLVQIVLICFDSIEKIADILGFFYNEKRAG
jgi:hypothetical protein